MVRDTDYATEIATAQDAQGQTIERIHVKEWDRPEIRFSWWKDGKMMMRPLDLPEDELLSLLRDAIQKRVFSDEFLRELHSSLYDAKRNNADRT